MNDHGKCLAVETTGKIHPSGNGAKIVQSTCNPYEKGQLWKYDEKSNSLCNDWNKCISTPLHLKGGKADKVFHSTFVDWETHQKWTLGSTKYKGMFINLGWCLAIEKNSDASDTRAITKTCKPGEKGITWSFAQYWWSWWQNTVFDVKKNVLSFTHLRQLGTGIVWVMLFESLYDV